MLQGAFLLVYDLLQFGAHHKNGKRLGQKFGIWTLGPTPSGMGLAYRFQAQNNGSLNLENFFMEFQRLSATFAPENE